MVLSPLFPPFGVVFVKYLQSLTPEQQRELEAQSVSLHSPEPVQDAELVVRALDQPLHFVGGEFTPAAFSDCASAGLSVDRLAHCTLEQAWVGAEARLRIWHNKRAADGKEQTQRHVIALTEFAVEELRAMRVGLNSTTRQAIGVFDTAKADNVAHADVILQVAGKPAERSLRLSFYTAAKRSIRFRPGFSSTD
jgi:hypothetical protein